MSKCQLHRRFFTNTLISPQKYFYNTTDYKLVKRYLEKRKHITISKVAFVID